MENAKNSYLIISNEQQCLLVFEEDFFWKERPCELNMNSFDIQKKFL